MTTLEITFESNELFPLYQKYDSQNEAQPAYIELDLETGSLTADYDSNVGGGTSEDKWNQRVLTWDLNAQTSVDDIKSILEENKPYFQTILDSSEIVHKDGNRIGVTQGYESINWDQFVSTELEGGVVESFGDWLAGEHFPKDGQTSNDFIKEVLELDGEDGWYIASTKSTFESVQDLMYDIWADLLYSDEDIPAVAAKALIEDGRCNDSTWTEELKEFANQ